MLICAIELLEFFIPSGQWFQEDLKIIFQFQNLIITNLFIHAVIGPKTTKNRNSN